MLYREWKLIWNKVTSSFSYSSIFCWKKIGFLKRTDRRHLLRFEMHLLFDTHLFAASLFVYILKISTMSELLKIKRIFLLNSKSNVKRRKLCYRSFSVRHSVSFVRDFTPWGRRDFVNIFSSQITAFLHQENTIHSVTEFMSV